MRGRLEAGSGGYEVVHASPGLEVGVYVLVAPEPDDQQPHAGAHPGSGSLTLVQPAAAGTRFAAAARRAAVVVVRPVEQLRVAA